MQEDTRDFKKIFEKVPGLTGELQRRIKKGKVKFRTVSIIMINTSLETKTRSLTLGFFSDKREVILEQAKQLLREFLEENPHEVLRRIGVRVSSLEHPQARRQKFLGEF